MARLSPKEYHDRVLGLLPYLRLKDLREFDAFIGYTNSVKTCRANGVAPRLVAMLHLAETMQLKEISFKITKRMTRRLNAAKKMQQLKRKVKLQRISLIFPLVGFSVTSTAHKKSREPSYILNLNLLMLESLINHGIAVDVRSR